MCPTRLQAVGLGCLLFDPDGSSWGISFVSVSIPDEALGSTRVRMTDLNVCVLHLCHGIL